MSEKGKGKPRKKYLHDIKCVIGSGKNQRVEKICGRQKTNGFIDKA